MVRADYKETEQEEARQVVAVAGSQAGAMGTRAPVQGAQTSRSPAPALSFPVH